MPESVTTSAEQWSIRVDEFIAENDELLVDPDLGSGAAQRLLVQAKNLLVEIIDDAVVVTNEWVAAMNKTAEMMNDLHCSAGKVNRQEKEMKALEAEHYSFQDVQGRLQDFVTTVEEAHDRICASYEKPGAVAITASSAPILSFWQRLLSKF